MAANLDTSKIGTTQVEVTKIGMGGAPLGSLDREIAFDTLDYAYQQGIRYFDTAPLYGAGPVSYTHLTLPTNREV